MLFRWLLGLALVAAGVGAVSGLASASSDNLGLSIQRIDASQFPTIVTLAGVVDKRGVPIGNLEPSAFTVTEDGQPVDNLQVDGIQDTHVPIAVGLVIDISGSMNDAGKLDAAKQAAGTFVDSLGPADTVAVIAFASSVTVVQPFSADAGVLHAAIDDLQAQGNTALYDAVQQTALLLDALPQPRRVLLLVTDGADSSSKTSFKDAVAATTAVHGIIMPIGLGTDVDRGVLDQLADATGGTALYPASADELGASFRSVLGQLRHGYVLRYTSRRTADDGSHDVSVVVANAGVGARATSTYLAKREPTASVSIGGLAAGDSLSGPRQVDVMVQTGTVQRLDLLVDGRAIATAVGQVSSLTAQMAPLPSGPHDVVVRVTDRAGGVTNQTLRVVGAQPTPEPPSPPATPAEPDRTQTPDQWPIVIAVLIVLILVPLLVGALVWVRQGQRVTTAAAGMGDDERTLDLDAPASPTTVPLTNTRLQVLHGAEMHEIALTGPELMIGRDPTNAVALQDPLASRKHARIVSDEDGAYWIEDLRSRNGTVLNEHLPILRHRLMAGDRITIGTTTLVFLQGSPTELPVATPVGVVAHNGVTRS